MPRFQPISPDRLIQAIVEAIDRCGSELDHPVRVALDGPACADSARLIGPLSDSLAARGRPVAVLRASDFYRDASVRLEYGRTDVESFYSGWLDQGTLVREVLAPLGRSGGAEYLPSLRDPHTNRSTRATPVAMPGHGVAVVAGELLLGTGLPFDLTVHLMVSRQARRRQTADELAWTLPAWDRYDLEVDPVAVADIVVRYDDPAHPAISPADPLS